MGTTTEATVINDLVDFAEIAYEIAKQDLDTDKSLAWKTNVQGLATVAEVSSVRKEKDNNTVSCWRVVRGRNDSVKKEKTASIEIIENGRSKAKTTEVPMITIPNVEKEPPMTYWTRIPCNIRIKEDQLHPEEDLADADDIPDHEREQVREMISISEREYLQPIRDSKLLKSMEIDKQLKDDQLFEIFVNTMLKYEKRQAKLNLASVQEVISKPTAGNSELNESSIFRAITEFAPNVGFPYQLRERYFRLTRGVETTTSSAPTDELKRKDILKPFQNNFCNRCYVYNCLVHDKKEKVEIENMKPPPTDFQEDMFPCSGSCYKHLLWKRRNNSSVPEAELSKSSPQADTSAVSDNAFGSDSSDDGNSSRGYDSMDTERTTEDDDSSDSDDSIEIVHVSQGIKNNQKQQFNKLTELQRNTKKKATDTRLNSEISFEDTPSAGEFDSFEIESEGRNQRLRSGSEQAPNYVDEASRLIFGAEVENEENVENNHDGETWSYDEVSIYLAMKTIWPNRYCSIARTVMTKTCQEVYLRAQSDEEKATPSDYYPLSGRRSEEASSSKRDSRLKSFCTHCKKTDMVLARPTDKKPKALPAYIPCHHEGQPCGPDICSCIVHKIPCEKFCGCTSDCVNKYPGCNCFGSCDTKRCDCVLANRECDMDVCGCSVRFNHTETKNPCKNVNIQNGLEKKMQRRISTVAGWGLFAAEQIKINEYIGEYVGELISTSESDLRGERYDKLKCTFLFGRDDLSTIDGMRFGNLTRFINSSSATCSANCFPVSMTVYGDIRIGLYASRNIAVDEELFFDYSNVIQQHMDETPTSRRKNRKECSSVTAVGSHRATTN